MRIDIDNRVMDWGGVVSWMIRKRGLIVLLTCKVFKTSVYYSRLFKAFYLS